MRFLNTKKWVLYVLVHRNVSIYRFFAQWPTPRCSSAEARVEARVGGKFFRGSSPPHLVLLNGYDVVNLSDMAYLLRHCCQISY